MQIALGTRQGEVVFFIPSAVLFRDDVLDLIRDERLVDLPSPAILATSSRPFVDAPPDRRADHADGLDFSTERALA